MEPRNITINNLIASIRSGYETETKKSSTGQNGKPTLGYVEWLERRLASAVMKNFIKQNEKNIKDHENRD